MKILNASDLAKEKGFTSHRDMVSRLHTRRPGIPKWNGVVGKKSPVHARVDFGRWIADCECGGAEYVDTSDPIFFCFSCGNKTESGNSRPVIFPNNVQAIETELLKRNVTPRAGKTPCEQAIYSIPEFLPRSWNVSESVEDLSQQLNYVKLHSKEK